jgi:hypothetical protein
MPKSPLELLAKARIAECRPPVTWDHLEVSFASSMGPPFRQ